MRNIIIGIAGGSGSGKSTLAANLLKALPSAILITQDDYYKKDNPASADFNYDQPAAFNTELLTRHLDTLLSGEAVDAPIYDYSRHGRDVKTRRLLPASVIILEGILVLESEELRRRMALSVFVDTPEADRLERRIQRDVRERGRSRGSVIEQFLKTVKPMHSLYVEPQKEHAQVRVVGGGMDPDTVNMLLERIRTLLETV